jgi:hypothetical protein
MLAIAAVAIASRLTSPHAKEVLYVASVDLVNEVDIDFQYRGI